MRKRIILIGLSVALLVGVYFAVDRLGGPEPEPQDDYTPQELVSIFNTSKNDIAAMTITTPEYSFSFEKPSGASLWAVAEKPNIRLNNSRIETLAYDFASINADVVIEDVGDPALFGFDSPLGTPSIRLTDGSEVSFVIGGKTPTGTGYYFKLEDSDDVYTIYSSKAEGFMAELDSFRNKTLAVIDPTSLTEITIKRSSDTIHMRLISEEDAASRAMSFSAWEMISPIKQDVSSYYFEESVYKKISSFDVTAFVDDAPSDYTAYGLDNPRYVIGFKYLGDENCEPAEKSVTFALGSQADGNIYVRMDGEPNVYALKEDVFAYRDADVMNLISTLVYIQHIDAVDRIKISGGGEEYTFGIVHDGDDMTFSINGASAGEKKFKEIYQELIGLFIRGTVADTPSGEPVFTAVYSFNDGRSDDIVTGIPYGDRYVAIDINGKSEYYVMKEQVEDLLVKIQDFSKNP